MSEAEQLLREISKHCDLDERIPLIPASAKVRGFYFHSMEGVVRDAGLGERYDALFPGSFSTLRWYPVQDYLERCAVAGALLASPERVHDGMQEVGRRYMMAFGESLIGRTMIRLLSRDPHKLLEQGQASRRQSCSFGRWDLEFPEEHVAIITMHDEYLYMESILRGAAEGTFESLGIRVDVEVELFDRFNGRHTLRW